MLQARKVSSSLVVAALVLLLTACAGSSKNIREASPENTDVKPDGSKAVLVLLRPSFVGGAIQSTVFEIKDGNPVLVGPVAPKAKLAYRVEPGEHLFMVISENADFMSADFIAGKTYYALVTPRMGMWKARFSLLPMHQDDLSAEKFKSYLSDCRKWIEKTPEADQWAIENMPSIQSKFSDYYAKWMSKSPAERPELVANDGQ